MYSGKGAREWMYYGSTWARIGSLTTSNAVMSVSLEPLLVCVCVDRRARMNAFAEQAGGFAINILSRDQEPLARYFAGQWEGAPPPYRLEPWVGGPRLEGCLAAVGCVLEGIYPGGTTGCS